MDSHSPQEAYQVLLDDHNALKELITRIEQALQQHKGTVAEMGDMLAEFGDRLIKHFALEEEGGYFAEAMLHAPQLVHRANALMEQHPLLCTQVRDLAEVATAAGDKQWWQETQQRFLAFQAALLAHERNEDGLLQEAYVNDLGSHD